MQGSEWTQSVVWAHWQNVLCRPQTGGPKGPLQLALNCCVIHFGSVKTTDKLQTLWQSLIANKSRVLRDQTSTWIEYIQMLCFTNTTIYNKPTFNNILKGVVYNTELKRLNWTYSDSVINFDLEYSGTFHVVIYRRLPHCFWTSSPLESWRNPYWISITLLSVSKSMYIFFFFHFSP